MQITIVPNGTIGWRFDPVKTLARIRRCVETGDAATLGDTMDAVPLLRAHHPDTNVVDSLLIKAIMHMGQHGGGAASICPLVQRACAAGCNLLAPIDAEFWAEFAAPDSTEPPDIDSWTLFHFVAAAGYDEAFCASLVAAAGDASALWRAETRLGNTPLHIAAIYGNRGFVAAAVADAAWGGHCQNAHRQTPIGLSAQYYRLRGVPVEQWDTTHLLFAYTGSSGMARADRALLRAADA